MREGSRKEEDGESNSDRQTQIETQTNGDGQTDRNTVQEDRNRKAGRSRNKRVYRRISNSFPSCPPAPPSRVDTLVPCCLTEVACWMLREHQMMPRLSRYLHTMSL